MVVKCLKAIQNRNHKFTEFQFFNTSLNDIHLPYDLVIYKF